VRATTVHGVDLATVVDQQDIARSGLHNLACTFRKFILGEDFDPIHAGLLPLADLFYHGLAGCVSASVPASYVHRIFTGFSPTACPGCRVELEILTADPLEADFIDDWQNEWEE
jgi:hypothetical protein